MVFVISYLRFPTTPPITPIIKQTIAERTIIPKPHAVDIPTPEIPTTFPKNIEANTEDAGLKSVTEIILLTIKKDKLASKTS